jgi:hypothetical protein
VLTILTSDRKTITLQQKLPPPEKGSPNWYNPEFKCITNIRLVKLKRTCPNWYIEAIIRSRRRLRIYTIVGHEPMFTAADEERIAAGEYRRSDLIAHQRMKDADGDDYIDEFGRYVYVVSRIGDHADVDLRYDKEPDPELFTLQLVEHDLCLRRGHTRQLVD